MVEAMVFHGADLPCFVVYSVAQLDPALTVVCVFCCYYSWCHILYTNVMLYISLFNDMYKSTYNIFKKLM